MDADDTTFPKDTVLTSMKNLITIWFVALVLLGSRSGDGSKISEKKYYGRCSFKSLVSCLPFLLSYSLLVQQKDEDRKMGVVLEEKKRRRRTAGFLLSELEPSHGSGQCSETKRRRRRQRAGKTRGRS